MGVSLEVLSTRTVLADARHTQTTCRHMLVRNAAQPNASPVTREFSARSAASADEHRFSESTTLARSLGSHERRLGSSWSRSHPGDRSIPVDTT